MIKALTPPKRLEILPVGTMTPCRWSCGRTVELRNAFACAAYADGHHFLCDECAQVKRQEIERQETAVSMWI